MSVPVSERRATGGPRAPQRGFSLVELMVGIVVALVIGIAATSSARVFGLSQRQGIGAGTASTGSATALAAIKNEITSAGLGFFGESKFKCYRMQLSNGASTLYDGGSFSPVLVTRDAATRNDQIDVLYSTSIDSGAGVLIASTSNGTTAAVQSYLPVAVGEAVMLSPKTAGAGAVPCTVRTVTSVVPATPTTRQQLTFANTGAYNQVAFTVPPSFIEQDRVVRLGDLRWTRYRVVGTDLMLERPLEGTSAILQRNVLALRALYGVADPVTKSLASWESPDTWSALTGTNVDNISALRVGIVARVAQRENKGTGCDASTGPPNLFGQPVTADVPDPTCYRYRSTEFIAPLRNLAW